MKIQNISFPVCVCIKLARGVRVKAKSDWPPYTVIWPMRGSDAGHGMIFVLSVLNRVYNFARVCFIYNLVNRVFRERLIYFLFEIFFVLQVFKRNYQ